jgi:hypothetical protein
MASELTKDSLRVLKLGVSGAREESRDDAKNRSTNFIRFLPKSEIFASCSIKNKFRYRKVRSLKYDCNNFLVTRELGFEIWKKKTS